MKTNIFKSSFLALAMMASFSACTQNEELGTPAPADKDILNVVAYSNNFVSTDAASRITDNGTTTTFTDGDAIGVFIVRDGEALVSNMKMTLNSNKWVGDANAPLYYYKNADYIAYYPYTANLAVTTVDEIVEYFTSKISATGQTSLADYRNADLMTAEVKAADVVRGQNITFSFAHKMAMLEVKAPVRSYTTSTTYGDAESAKAFTYKAPLGLKVDLIETDGNKTTLSLCNVGTEADATSGKTKDIFRCILVPSDKEKTIEGQFQDGSVEVYFPEVEKVVKYTPAAGTYQGINISYDYTNYTSTRDLKVGDYYYSDGSIYPGDLAGAPKDGCVGIIFSTTVSATDKTKWPHGYVIALKNTNGKIGDYSASKWSSNASVTLENNTLTSGGDLNDFDGYTASYSEALSAIDAVKAAKEYSKPIPEGTSGWYLPSAAQLTAVMNNLYTADGWKFGKDDAYSTNTTAVSQADRAVALLAIQKLFENVGGVLLGVDEADFNINPTATTTDRWWSTTESSTVGKAWCLELKNNGQLKLLERDKASGGTNGASVRPVFAF